jgi:hypothetical protein
MVQPVLTQDCSALRYIVAFVAIQEIDPGVELVYSYGQRYFFKGGQDCRVRVVQRIANVF